MTLLEYMKLRNWRHATDVAHYFGLNVSTVCRWLRGETRPSGANVLILVRGSGGLISLEGARANLGTTRAESTP